MMFWQTHDSFDADVKKLGKKYPQISLSIEKTKRLLSVQFSPTSPQAIIGPGKIHRVTANQTWEMWKVEVVVEHLRPSQWPRFWFVVSGDTITFLVANTHVNNHDDNECNRLAMSRYSEIA